MEIPKENMAKLTYKWPITPITNEKEIERKKMLILWTRILNHALRIAVNSKKIE